MEGSVEAAWNAFELRLQQICQPRGIDSRRFSPTIIPSTDQASQGSTATCPVCMVELVPRKGVLQGHVLSNSHAERIAAEIKVDPVTLISETSCPHCRKLLQGNRGDLLKDHMRKGCLRDPKLPQELTEKQKRAIVRQAGAKFRVLAARMRSSGGSLSSDIYKEFGPPALPVRDSSTPNHGRDVHIAPLLSVPDGPPAGTYLPPISSFDEGSLVARLSSVSATQVLEDLRK